MPRRTVAILSLLLTLPAAFGAPRLNEFMAENDGFLSDEDGDSPDWIELHNPSVQPVNLEGWHLTDDPNNLAKWTLPATNLAANGYLIVFASGKDRTRTGAELHTNFQLDNAGEYLALVAPDGVTIVREFSPEFPPQRANVSFGQGQSTAVTPLVSVGGSARVLVPADGSLGNAWTLPGFNDAAWLPATTGIGYDTQNPTNGPSATVILSLDFNYRGNTAGATPAGFTSFVINSEVSSTAIQTNPTVRTFGSITVTLSNTAPNGYDDRLRNTPVNSGAFTESLLLRDFVFSRAQTDTGGLDLLLSGLPPSQPFQITLWSFDTSSLGNRVADWYANGALVRAAYTFGGQNLPVSNDDYRFTFTAASDAAGRILVSGRRNPTSLDSGGSASYGVFLNALQVAQLGYRPLIATDLQSAMHNRNTTAFVRIPFTVADPTDWQSLVLRMKYDDGFAAYLNGQLVAARNAPGVPLWNSAATAAHPNTEAIAFEEILLDNPPGLLVAGANVLAIHGLNLSAADTDFLLVPELEGLAIAEFAQRYFTPPTPGAENSLGFLGFVADTKFSVNRGFYDTPFTVAITSATATAQIFWTTDGSPPTPTNGMRYTAPVPVTNTTFLRAAAFAPNLIATEIETHTYIFLGQVLHQPATQPGYPTTWQASYPADYGMDPTVVNHPQYGATLSNDLRTLPTLSIVTDHDSLWGPSRGIYPNAVNAGEAWERAASAELIQPDGATAFAVNCGLRMQGNASRDNNRTPKHSFRLLFQSDYGPAKLRYDWFPGSPVSRFDNIVLRACFTDAWTTRYSPNDGGARYRPEDSLYLRDVWMKDSQLAMGSHSARNNFVHLYINGLYWGLYNPCERLDASHFTEHFGGREMDWDVIRDFNELLDGTTEAWNELMALLNAGITSEATYQAVQASVDIDNLMDYMLLHVHAEAEDWPHHNWYAARRRAAPDLPANRWLFAVWDQEIVCDQLVPRNRVDVNNDFTPARVYSQLRAWPEFRVQFGDRVQRHLFNGGALDPTNSVALLQARAAQVHQALVGESARWGDAREFTIGANPGTGQTFTRDEWWVPELAKLYTNWFPRQRDLTLARLRAAGLFPAISAPDFNPFGGAVPADFALALTHTNTAGTVFFTLDGADPRVYGSGAIAPSAQTYDAPVPLNAPTLVRARVRDGAIWSALIEAMFYPPQDLTRLALTEIMYNPPPWGGFSGGELEFLELQNTGTNPLNLSGLAFTAGITFSFTNGTLLAPGAFLVLARNAAAFAARYPGVPVAGVFAAQLDNAGEPLRLSHPTGGTVFALTYGDRAPWPVAPDNHDYSLVPREPGLTQAPDNGAKWRASTHPGGSPGAADPESLVPNIVINEVLSASLPPTLDTIELFNPTAAAVDIGGWFLTDEPGTPAKFRIPAGTTIPARGWVVFDETAFNAAPGAVGNFALNGRGDQVYLFSANAAGDLTGYSHGFNFDAAEAGATFGRYVNSVGDEHFPELAAPSFGLDNRLPRVGPVVLNEIQYHPALDGDEFVELLNTTVAPVPLFDTNFPGHSWRLDGLDFTLPPSVSLPAHGLLLVVNTNPADFRAEYGVPAEVEILGPYPGVLQDSGERLRLVRPTAPDTNGVAWITVDEVRYNDKAPWPPAADGSGPSLQRILGAAYGDDPLNWQADAPTPGQANPPTSGDLDGDGLPDSWEVAHGTNPLQADAAADPDGDGLTNRQEHDAGTDPLDAGSALRIATLAPAGNGLLVVLTFPAMANHSYSVLGRATPQSGAWEEVWSMPATATHGSVAVTNAIGTNATRYFRLVTPRW